MDIKKPKKFENRKLGFEKTTETKFKVPRKFIQNTVTHYNYYFNANNKLNLVIARAKEEQRENYRRLLPFYNYSLASTARSKGDLDSVIYKATAGILLHDLRNNWVDNLYMLIGKAYFLKNNFDSAYATFQYVNYAFAPKDNDGYDRIIGSNANEGGSTLSVSTNEKQNLLKKTLERLPSRNEALIWQIRTQLEMNNFTQSAVLMQTLRHDPLFPERLNPALEEMQALYFYKTNLYDSAAIHLQLALPAAENNFEMSRWEYLVAQLYELAGGRESAKTWFESAAKHTINPILEVYASLNAIRQTTGDRDIAIDNALTGFMKMARKDKYITYRDLIYFTAAEMELERNNTAAAKQLLLKSVRTSMDNPEQKSNSFLRLGDISYHLKEYPEASRYYDSVGANMVDSADLTSFLTRRASLTKIALQSAIIDRQDSLQRIAALPQKERDVLIRKMVRQLRRQQGLKEEELTPGSSGAPLGGIINNTPAVDLFAGDKSDFYFYNANQKGRGYSDFRSRWGNRPNVDNWQRMSAIANAVAVKQNGITSAGGAAIAGDATPTQNTFEGMLALLPTTPEKLKASNDSVSNAFFTMGVELQNGLEEYQGAIDQYDSLLIKFPVNIHREEALFNLYYCYRKIGNTARMAEAKAALEKEYGGGKFTAMVNNNTAGSPIAIKKEAATAEYNKIYEQFIEGNFDSALVRKKMADSTYGTTYWTPQLLYIEAVYHIRNREDSVAKDLLRKILLLYPTSPMFKKTESLIGVLNRRKEIEDYLTKLEIQRPKDDSMPDIDTSTTYRETKVTQRVVKDTNRLAPPLVKAPTTAKLKTDSVVAKQSAGSGFTNTPDKTQFVALILDKVDPVYVNEAKNAFNRYHKEKYYNKTFEITTVSLNDDIKLVIFKDFENALAALDYIQQAKKQAPVDIIPWLTESKYSFAPLTPANLEVLIARKDIAAYRKFLHAIYPDRY